MSWDCRLVDPVTRETLETDKIHDIAGGTYCIGGTREMENAMTVRTLIKHLTNAPADAEVVVLNKNNNRIYLNTMCVCCFYRNGEKPEIRLFENVKHED